MVGPGLSMLGPDYLAWPRVGIGVVGYTLDIGTTNIVNINLKYAVSGIHWKSHHRDRP